MWFIEQFEPGDSAYLMPAAVRIHGEVNLPALNQSLTEILRRHESLRTTFKILDDDPVQIIEPPRPVSISVCDLRAIAEPDRQAMVTGVSLVEARRPFDPTMGPLLRLSLLRAEDHEHILLLTAHHILMDGWSLGLLVDELARLYDDFSRGADSSLSELPVQYADYVYWQRELLEGPAKGRLLDYWREQLAELPPLYLPTDRPRPRVLTSGGGNLECVVPPPLLDSLKALGRRQEVSLFMTLLAAFGILLRDCSRQQCIAVGTDIASRNRPEIESLIGFFVNHLVLRVDLSGDPTVVDLLARVREVTLSAYAHQDLPFDLLVEDLQPERAHQRTPLFQVLFVLQNARMPALELNGLTLREVEIENGTTKYELVVILREGADGLSVTWKFNTDLFNRETIEIMSERFMTLLDSIVSDPTARLNSLQSLTLAERDHIQMEKMERRESALNRLKNVQRRPINLLSDALVRTENMQPGQQLPLVVRPTLSDVDLADWGRNNQEFVSDKLSKHGALLFRGFPLKSADDFEQVASALCSALHGDYGDLPREDVGGHIYSSTPYPADQTILFHNESSHMHCWPLKQFFFCQKAAEQGGETPLVDCREVYRRLSPAIKLKIAQSKLLYVRNFSDGLDISWPAFFHTSDRSAVEQYCREAGIEVEWKQGDSLRTRQIRPGVAVHPRTADSVFFNQIQAHHISCVEPKTRESLLSIFGEEHLPRNVYYGDGEPMEWPVVQEICEVYNNLAVSFAWQEGDLLMLDNMLTAHGRYPYKGQRKILVAMGEMMREEDLYKGVPNSSLQIGEPTMT